MKYESVQTLISSKIGITIFVFYIFCELLFEFLPRFLILQLNIMSSPASTVKSEDTEASQSETLYGIFRPIRGFASKFFTNHRRCLVDLTNQRREYFDRFKNLM